MGKLDYKVFSIAIFSISILTISGAFQDAHAGAPGSDTILYAVDKGSDELRVLDRTDASTVSSVTMTLAGEDIDGAQGLAVDPTTGTFWVILKTGNGECGRELATLNPSTGVATSIGFMDDCYAGLEFSSAGILFGVIGDGGDDSETLKNLSKATAASTHVCDLGNGGDGETIVNAAGTWYHWSGHTPGDSDGYIMETFDINTCSTTDIPRNSDDGWTEEVIAGAYCSEYDQIIVSEEHSSPSTLLSVSPSGIPTTIGVVDSGVGDDSGGFTVAGLACTGDLVIPVTTPGDVYVVMGQEDNTNIDDGSLATANFATGVLTQVDDSPTIADEVNEGGSLSGLAIDSFGRFYVTANPGGSSPSDLVRVDNEGNILNEIGVTQWDNDGTSENVKVRDLSFQPGTDVLFGVGVATEGVSNPLFTIDTSDATVEILGTIEAETIRGLAFDPTDDTLYGVGCSLYTIDPTDPSVTTFVTELDRCYDGLGIDSLGQIFGTETGPDSVHLIDTSDGSDITVAGIGENPSDVDFIVEKEIQEVHCDTEFDWLSDGSEGERGELVDGEIVGPGIGECIITYTDGTESSPIEVEVSGGFGVDAGDFPLVDLESFFLMETSDGVDKISLEEAGLLEYDLESPPPPFFDYTIETTGDAESMGVFGDLSECSVETHGAGSGLFSSTDATRTIWIICEKPLLPDFSDDASTYPRPHLGDGRYGGGHDNGFCMDQNCMDVRSNYFNHFPETAVNQGSTHTFTLLVSCQRGADTCIHASIGGALPDSTFYDTRWDASLDKDIMTGIWTLTVTNDHGEIGTVTGTVQEVGDTFIQVSFNIQFLVPASVGTHEGDGDPHENNRHLHVTVYDNQRGMSNYIFNDGMIVEDIYAYPVVDMSFDAELEYEPLCLNEDSTMRYTCAFDKVKDWTIKNAENTLKEMYDQRGQDMDSYDESEQN